jgi:hypothetical protein
VSLLACTLGRPSSSFPISAQCRAALPGSEIYSDTLAYNVLAKLHHYPASEWAWLEAIAPVLKASRGEFQDPRFADTGRRSLSLPYDPVNLGDLARLKAGLADIAQPFETAHRSETTDTKRKKPAESGRPRKKRRGEAE